MHRAGFDDALMLTLDGFVAEATTANVFVRLGSQWVTPAATDDILPGITRRQVIELIQEQTGRSVQERRIHRSELFACEEMLLCGTATIVVPVINIDGVPVGNGAPGEMTMRPGNLIQAIARRAGPRASRMDDTRVRKKQPEMNTTENTAAIPLRQIWEGVLAQAMEAGSFPVIQAGYSSCWSRRRVAKNARISSRAAIVGWPASSMR